MLFKRVLQKVWDWRAAGNFILGGCGSGLLVLTSLLFFTSQPSLVIILMGMVLIGMGLFLVWLEIGKPFRAINVFFHPKTSWMSREAIVATVLFSLGAFQVLWVNSFILMVLGLVSLGFLYCQARILKASKGIPAWRAAGIVPLILSTGFVEGAGVLLFASPWLFDALAPGLFVLFALFVLAVVYRYVFFERYRSQLEAQRAPEAAIEVISRVKPALLFVGAALPLLLLLIQQILPNIPSAFVMVAGATALLTGWYLKFSIVVRAAHFQGYGIPVRMAKKPLVI